MGQRKTFMNTVCTYILYCHSQISNFAALSNYVPRPCIMSFSRSCLVGSHKLLLAVKLFNPVYPPPYRNGSISPRRLH